MPPSLQAFLILFVVGAALRLSGLLGKVHAKWLGAMVFSIGLLLVVRSCFFMQGRGFS